VSIVVLRMSNGRLLGELLGRGMDAVAEKTAQERGLWQELDSAPLEPGFRIRGRVDDEWGRSESIDPDNVGDIADEGMGHRG
jgi:hypothetical protein